VLGARSGGRETCGRQGAESIEKRSARLSRILPRGNLNFLLLTWKKGDALRLNLRGLKGKGGLNVKKREKLERKDYEGKTLDNPFLFF